MVGQVALLAEIDKQIENGTFPRFSIVTGDNQRNCLAEYVANKLNATCVQVTDCKVETIRDIIVNAYKVSQLTIYNIQDADFMSTQARNALLKVTEEPPNKAYFIMTLQDVWNTLNTLRSRGSLFHLDPYKRKELEDYIKVTYPDSNVDLILKLVNIPEDIDKLVTYGVEDFYSFVCKTVDKIAEVSGSNALKIPQSIKMKDTDDTGYDMRLFWKVFCVICMEKGYYNGLRLTSKYICQLRSKSINRAMLFDSWILDIRLEWQDGNN